MAEEPKRADSLPDTRPYTLAAAFLRAQEYGNVRLVADARGFDQFHVLAVTGLRHWRNEFYAFDRCVYRKIEDEELVADVDRFLNGSTAFAGRDNREVPIRVTRAVRADVIAQLAALCQVRAKAVPVWLDADVERRPDPRHVIGFQNGLLDYQDWIRDPLAGLTPPTHNWFSPIVLPREFDPAARCPAILAFLRQAIGEQQMLLLQEYAGYLLTREIHLQKMLFLHGVGGGGKGTIVRLLTELVGQQNTVEFKLHDLAQQFDLESWMGKTLAVCAETVLDRDEKIGRIVGPLLSIVGQDRVSVDRKHMKKLSGVQLDARLVLAMNTFPNLPDGGVALKRRALVISFDRSFAGNPDPHLLQKLLPEMAGFTAWAMAGLRRLWANDGRFTSSDRGDELLERLGRVASPVKAFVEECLEVVPEELDGAGKLKPRPSETKRQVYGLWCWWAKEKGHKATTDNTFAERLYEATLNAVKEGRPWLGDGKDKRRSQVFYGLRFRREYLEFVPSETKVTRDYEHNEQAALTYQEAEVGQGPQA